MLIIVINMTCTEKQKIHISLIFNAAACGSEVRLHSWFCNLNCEIPVNKKLLVYPNPDYAPEKNLLFLCCGRYSKLYLFFSLDTEVFRIIY